MVETKFVDYSKRENSVKIRSEVKHNGEWIDYSFSVDYEIFNDENRFRKHQKMWARKKLEKLKDERNVEDLKGSKI